MIVKVLGVLLAFPYGLGICYDVHPFGDLADVSKDTPGK
jgi:hypothetical protein